MKASKVKAVDKLKAQRDKLNARIQAAEAREKSGERKKDTRRKVLVGAYYLDKASKDTGGMDAITQKLDGYLTRDSDRALFNLPVKTEQKTGTEKTAQD
jgi:hypothetical protein